MDQRRALAYRVLVGGVSVSQAAREFLVSRLTARRWVERARELGLSEMAEVSRRPVLSPTRSSGETVEALLAKKVEYPYWGAKKLMAILWPDQAPPFCLRTANRILSRAELSCRRPKIEGPSIQRFERDEPNELWQMDFKGLKYPRVPYEAFSVVDDASRFCLCFSAVQDQTLETVWAHLWMLFGEHGLPLCILCDNGSAFRAFATALPSKLEMRLLQLGVRTAHGRPYHPQTQGKVERFHATVQLELGADLRHPSAALAQPHYDAFRDRYNWVRPHEALHMACPGGVYRASSRVRPDRLPTQDFPVGAITRKVNDYGTFGFKSDRYRIGRGLAGERIELREIEDGQLAVLYFGVTIANLSSLTKG